MGMECILCEVGLLLTYLRTTLGREESRVVVVILIDEGMEMGG